MLLSKGNVQGLCSLLGPALPPDKGKPATIPWKLLTTPNKFEKDGESSGNWWPCPENGLQLQT